MTHYIIELALFCLGAYLLGCLLGWILRNIFGKGQKVAPAVKVADVAVPAAVAAVAAAAIPRVAVAAPVAPADPIVAAPARVVAAPAPVIKAPTPVAPVEVAAAPNKMERPRGLKSARGGKSDDLQRISGIGPKNEAILHNLGFFHFDQIAAWTKAEVVWVDDHLRFGGRIQREEWIRQARLLADGKEEQFTKEFGTGGLKAKDGQTLSGTRTRKN